MVVATWGYARPLTLSYGHVQTLGGRHRHDPLPRGERMAFQKVARGYNKARNIPKGAHRMSNARKHPRLIIEPLDVIAFFAGIVTTIFTIVQISNGESYWINLAFSVLLFGLTTVNVVHQTRKGPPKHKESR